MLIGTNHEILLELSHAIYLSSVAAFTWDTAELNHCGRCKEPFKLKSVLFVPLQKKFTKESAAKFTSSFDFLEMSHVVLFT